MRSVPRRRLGIPVVSPAIKARVFELKASGCKQHEIAVKLGIGQSTVSRILRGER